MAANDSEKSFAAFVFGSTGGESGDMEFVYPLYHVFYVG
jgi:hypothetical protein